MNTLDMLLEACNSLQANVDIRGIFVNLMDRLSSFANENELKVAQEVDIYELFKTNIDKIVDNREKNFELKKLLEL